MEKQLLFKLCEGCFISKCLSKFYIKHQICKVCVKRKIKHPRSAYYIYQDTLPIENRMAICNTCFEEKESKFFSVRKSGKLRTECNPCRSSKQWAKIKENGKTDKQRLSYNKAMRQYKKRRKAADPEFAFLVDKLYPAQYRAMKLSILDLMPDDWWNILLEICEYRCLNPNCEKKINERNPLSHDHVIPVSIEGSIHSLGNSQVLCKSCNSSKQNKNSDDYRTQEMKEKLEAYDQLKINRDTKETILIINGKEIVV